MLMPLSKPGSLLRSAVYLALTQSSEFASAVLAVAQRNTRFISIKELTYQDLFDTISVGGTMIDTSYTPKDRVRVSPKFQVVIPKKIREQLELKPGEELQIYLLDQSIRIHRPRSIKDLRGMAKGMKWKDEDRDHTDRF
jgi:AbrB family looped-hinge helix DNA binding protein